jgi:pantoate--beta-alanine ligase
VTSWTGVRGRGIFAGSPRWWRNCFMWSSRMRRFFGQKDAAQVAIIRRMVRDLNFPVEIVACPIVREPDGLAMSSRNAYLDPQQRKQALVLHRSLMRVKKMWEGGERDAEKLVAAGREELAREKSVSLDYFEIVDPDSLDPVEMSARVRWSRSPHS